MKRFFYLLIPLFVLTFSCSDDNDSSDGNLDVQTIEKHIAGKSWIASVVQIQSQVKVLCQYDFHKDHTALCQVMRINEIDDEWTYTIDSLNVKWTIVENYQGYKEAGLEGTALKIAADTTETFMIVKSVENDKMVCAVAIGEYGEEVVFDRIQEKLDIDGANQKLAEFIGSLPGNGQLPLTNDNLSNWMGSVNDTVKVRNMSIPGTHDATTYNVNEIVSFAARSQDLNLSQQWDAGVRAFDFRVRQGYMYHDFIPCNMSLRSALKAIVEKVQKNKETDGAIIICKTEGNAYANNVGMFSGALSWFVEYVFGLGLNMSSQKLNEQETVADLKNAIKTEIIDKNLLAEFKPNMTMKDLRGKILIINRNGLGANACYGPHASGWSGDKLLTTADGTSAKLYVQDEYEPDKDKKETEEGYIDRKKNVFKNTWKSSMAKNDTWVINQASGYVFDLLFPDYATLAKKAYPTMIETIYDSHGKGIILQDYAGVYRTCRISATSTSALVIPTLIIPTWFDMRKKAMEKVLKLAKKIASEDEVYGAQMVYAVVENNFK